MRFLRPRAPTWAQKVPIYSKNGGYPMIMELTKEANELGYQVTHLLIDGGFTGLNHSRKRFFFYSN